MNKENKLIKNTVIISIGKVCTQLITFFLLPVYTTYLSTEQYGTVDLLNTLVSFLLPIITLQLEQGAFRLLIDYRNDEKNTKKIITTTTIFLSINSVVYIAVFLMFSRFVHNEYKYFLLTNVIACIFSTMLLQISRGIGNNAGYAKASFINAVVTIILNLVLILAFKLGAYGMLIGTLIGNVVSIIYIIFTNKIYKYLKISMYDKNILKSMLKYSIPLIPNMISWWIVNVSDRGLVTLFLGITQNGILSVANKIPHVFTTLYTVVNMAWTESISENIDSNDRNEFFSKVFDIVVRLFGTCCIMVIAVLPFVFPLLINEKFGEAYVQIPILIIAVMFNILVSFIGSIYVATKKTKEIARTSMLAAIINLVINIIFIKVIGLYAATISTAIAYITMFIYRWYDSKKYVNIKCDNRLIISELLCFVTVTIGYYLNNNIICAIILVFILFYSIYINKNSFTFLNNILRDKLKKRGNYGRDKY